MHCPVAPSFCWRPLVSLTAADDVQRQLWHAAQGAGVRLDWHADEVQQDSESLLFHPLQVADIEKAEREKMADKCKRIIGHGINCFVNRQLIYNFPEQIFADNGVMAIEHADFDGIERLALVTGKPPLVRPHSGFCSM